MTQRRRTKVIAVPKKPSVWQSWRHFAAYVYLGICLFDFVLMPIAYELFHRSLGPVALIQASRGLDPAAQVEIIKTFSANERWEPLTLGETGLFHIAFGAILGVSAWTRGREKHSRIQNGMPEAYDYCDEHEDSGRDVNIHVKTAFEPEPEIDLNEGRPA